MPKPRTARLKVFQAHFGFYDTIVAAPSQAAAMRAWGTRQNVFADGQAKVTTDEAAVAAATAQPETVLKRPIGSDGAFEVEPTSLPSVPGAPPRKPGQKLPGSARPGAPPKPADRAQLDAAEGKLRGVEERWTADDASFRERQAALDAEKVAAEAAYSEARRAAMAQVAEAREVYRKAGGRD